MAIVTERVLDMCGRYGFSFAGDEKMDKLLDIMERKYPGGYKLGEISPGDVAPAIILQSNRFLPVPGRFGFPGFEKSRPLINARSETAEEKPTFAHSFRNNRVIIPANGFYEWSHESTKTKYWFTNPGSPVIYLCGLYRMIEDLLHFVILTRAANESMLPIHDRMPVMVPETQVGPYLADYEVATKILKADAPLLMHEPA